MTQSGWWSRSSGNGAALDVLVNNASVITYHPPMGHHDGAVGRGDEYKRTGDPPDVPPGLTVHDAGGAGRHHQHRVIILCRLPDGDYGADATSKWGVVSYTASQGHSLRPYVISVNCINPDCVDTIWPGLTILMETRTG